MEALISKNIRKFVYMVEHNGEYSIVLCSLAAKCETPVMSKILDYDYAKEMLKFYSEEWECPAYHLVGI